MNRWLCHIFGHLRMALERRDGEPFMVVCSRCGEMLEVL